MVILDTEYTSWKGSMERNWSGPNEHREIVQIAAIIVDSNNLSELEHFSILIQPKLNPILSNYFVNLTGINYNMLKEGKSFKDAILEYKDFIDERPVFACGNEGEIISENLYINSVDNFKELLNVSDLRPWFSANGLDADTIPSGELHKYLGIGLKGSAHNALHDVRSILASIKYLVKNGALNPFLFLK